MPIDLEHSGTAVSTTIVGSITGADTTLTLTDATGWPTGAGGKFYAVLGRGLTGEELILVTSRAGTALSGISRGQGGTSAGSWNGTTIKHCWTAIEAGEANTHLMSTAEHGAVGAVVGTANTQTLTNKTLTAPTLTSPVIDQFGSASGLGAAWSPYTPTLANLTLGNGTLAAAKKTTGKTVEFRIEFTLGSTSAVSTNPTFSLGVTPTALQVCSLIIRDDSAGQYYAGGGLVTTGGVVEPIASGHITATAPITWAVNDKMILTGSVEIA